MSKPITVKLLRRLGACEDQVTLFRETFGDSVIPTPELAERYGDLFDIDWLAHEALKAPLWEAYQEAKVPLLKAFVEAAAPLLKAYEEAETPSREVYEEAEAPLLKAYKVGIAKVFIELW